MSENCQHKWSEIGRGRVVTGFVKPGLFTNGYVQHGHKILQQCEKCGLNNVVTF